MKKLMMLCSILVMVFAASDGMAGWIADSLENSPAPTDTPAAAAEATPAPGEYQDITLVCRDCGNEFVFSAGEQEFYAEKGFLNQPTRCKACRIARKNAQKAETQTERKMYDAVCSECGTSFQVPYEPKNDRPIYCSSCFNARRAKLY